MRHQRKTCLDGVMKSLVCPKRMDRYGTSGEGNLLKIKFIEKFGLSQEDGQIWDKWRGKFIKTAG